MRFLDERPPARGDLHLQGNVSLFPKYFDASLFCYHFPLRLVRGTYPQLNKGFAGFRTVTDFGGCPKPTCEATL
jgi:hypothetical protein